MFSQKFWTKFAPLGRHQWSRNMTNSTAKNPFLRPKRTRPSQKEPVKENHDHGDSHHDHHSHNYNSHHPSEPYAAEHHATYPSQAYMFGEPASNYLGTPLTIITVATYAIVFGLWMVYPSTNSPMEV